MDTDWKRASLEGELQKLDDAGLRRSLRSVSSAQAAHVMLEGREVINFSSNNYLGFAAEPELRTAATAAVEQWGCGSGASRLIVGNQLLHEELETRLASLHRTQSALLFNSGYHANVGVISGLVGRGDVVFSDELNHASIIDGCRLSRADVVVYPHSDMERLRALVDADQAAHPTRRRRLIASDAVFSMDGDLAAVKELTAIARAFRCWLLLDEAHAIGAFGESGAGLAASLDCADSVDLVVGTLGKSVGSFGGYVAGSNALCSLLLQRARSFVFTTALPPAVVAASIRGLELTVGSKGTARRVQLAQNIEAVKAGLGKLGLLECNSGNSAIFPILVGESARTMSACQALLEAGVYVQGIRPPTVPFGSARLRLAVMATHSASDIDAVLNGLGSLKKHGLL